ncbi:MAG: asparaginase [Acidobacteria bacterium]|nr:asparaginase [Acidobacteriota bacterium]
MGKKNVLLIHTGGTLGMVEGKPDNHLKPAQIHESVLNFVPELSELAQLESTFPCNIDSANLDIPDMNNVLSTIRENYDTFDGFVILHGTDTMPFHASALSFMVENNRKPIIFTGSQKPLRHIRTDARVNLVNSVEFATMGIPEVCICFNSILFRGNRTRKVSIGRFDAFRSPNYPILGSAGVDIQLKTKHIADFPAGKTTFVELHHHTIGVIKLFPGFDATASVAAMLQSGVQAVVVEAYAAGNIPILTHSFIPSISAMTKAGLPVFIVSQALEGSVDLDLYECGQKAKHAGAIGCKDITFEAAITKLYYLFSKFPAIEREKLGEKMVLNLSGEIS